jgi:hypothetical protein
MRMRSPQDFRSAVRKANILCDLIPVVVNSDQLVDGGIFFAPIYSITFP